MIVFKNKYFHLWAKAEGLTNKILKKAIDEIELGLFDANLGGGLYKKLANYYLEATRAELDNLINSSELFEIKT